MLFRSKSTHIPRKLLVALCGATLVGANWSSYGVGLFSSLHGRNGGVWARSPVGGGLHPRRNDVGDRAAWPNRSSDRWVAVVVMAAPTDVVAASEGGMLGLAVDPNFAANRSDLYLFRIESGRSAGRACCPVDGECGLHRSHGRADIVTGIPLNLGGSAGRHSGCRLRFGQMGRCGSRLATVPARQTPQNPLSLGGKVLRVTTTWSPAPGNPGGSLGSENLYPRSSQRSGPVVPPVGRCGILHGTRNWLR